LLFVVLLYFREIDILLQHQCSCQKKMVDARVQLDVRLMRASSGASFVASLFLLVLLYKLKKAAKTKSVVNSIMSIIAVANLLLSASIFIGQPHNGTALCWIQAVTTNYFCLVHIFWTTMLAYSLFKATKDSLSANVFSKVYLCFGFVFPLVVTLFPLTTNKFGNPHDDERGWCFLDNRKDSPGITVDVGTYHTCTVVIELLLHRWNCIIYL
jgi:hypothetical protein